MEQRKEAELEEIDVASISVLLGVVAAAFVALGVIIYFFGEDQSSTISAANNPPTQTERMIRSKSAPPTSVGQGRGGQSNSQ
ncbi:MAG TPA: hypothetical protein VFB68_09530 [Xanthobacteraceae bacterium]|nr:hypothetical protein [Xanthobacteraceae bacterium]